MLVSKCLAATEKLYLLTDSDNSNNDDNHDFITDPGNDYNCSLDSSSQGTMRMATTATTMMQKDDDDDHDIIIIIMATK